MSVRVRLTRVGNKKNPIWRVVVADQRSPRDGRSIETLGHYNPQTEPSTIVIDRERLDFWLQKGAQPTGTVKKLLRAPNTEIAAPPAPVEEATAAEAEAAAEAPADVAAATEPEAAPEAEATPDAGSDDTGSEPDPEAPAPDAPAEPESEPEASEADTGSKPDPEAPASPEPESA